MPSEIATVSLSYLQNGAKSAESDRHALPPWCKRDFALAPNETGRQRYVPFALR